MKRVMISIGLLLAIIISIIAFAPVSILNNITPSSGFDLQKSTSFGDNPRFELDIYNPKTPRPNTPVLIFVHGGSWTDGSKDIYKFIGEAFTTEGYTAIIPNYRLYPGIAYPDPVTDTAKSIAWAAKQYPDRPLVILGHSAGGYNVLMAGLDPQFLQAEGVDTCRHIAGIVSLAGPTGIVPLKEEPYITIFPDRFTTTDAPLHLALKPSPPVLFLHGGKDDTVYPQSSERLAEKIIARGGQADVKIYPELGHTEVVKVLSRYFDDEASLKSDLFDFVKALPQNSKSFCR